MSARQIDFTLLSLYTEKYCSISPTGLDIFLNKIFYVILGLYMEIATKKFRRILLALTTVGFLWVSVFGLVHSMNDMKMNSDGIMSGCLFSGQATVCTMNFAEHIDHWQAMFTTLPQKAGLLELMILALVLTVVAVIFGPRLLFEHSGLLYSRQRLYIKQNPHILLFNSLREAFSQGILNPKIYDSATV